MFRFFNNLQIRTKLVLGFGIFLLINAVAGAYICISVTKLQKSVETSTELTELKGKLQRFEKNLVEAQGYLNTFISSGDTKYRDIYQNHLTILQQQAQELEDKLELFNSEYSDKWGDIQEGIQKWKLEITEKQLESMRHPETVDLARLYGNSRQKEVIWGNLKNNIENLNTKLSTILNAENKTQFDHMNSAIFASFFGILFMLVAGIIIATSIVIIVSGPLKNLVWATNSLIGRDWDIQISGTEREDEIGDMARALELFRESGMENERLQKEQEEKDQVRINRARVIEDLVTQFNKDSDFMMDSLVSVSEEMKQVALDMTSIAEEAREQSHNVASSAEEAGTNVQSVASATEELTSSIQEISKQLNEASGKTRNALSSANDAVAKMQGLEGAANEIGQIVEIINDIAEQTNLLALNATIESARAGEAGKGFAVVANEVKSLASQTGEATEKIQNQIRTVQSETEHAVTMMKNISKVISDLNETATSIASAMEEQTSATQEISRNISEAAEGTSEVVKNISNVNNTASKAGETAKSVEKVSQSLSDQSGKMKYNIEQFITDITAA